MNCPSRPDPEAIPNGWNQSPDPMALYKNSDMNGIANARTQRDHRLHLSGAEVPLELQDIGVQPSAAAEKSEVAFASRDMSLGHLQSTAQPVARSQISRHSSRSGDDLGTEGRRPVTAMIKDKFVNVGKAVFKYGTFVGPGFMISVAYIDPGNYATDIAAGASYQFRLLVMVLVSNIIAIFLQSLCIKMGSVTGMNLAEMCKRHCPKWLNYVLYFFAEAAIIVTDIAEVIGTAIALNLLLKIPLVAGCAISILDVLIILLFYKPTGTMRGIRVFEFFVAALVVGVVICFCFELSLLSIPSVGTLFRGFLPSSALVQGQGLYQACGILGATVMPHSLYLGSGIVKPRLYDYDHQHGNLVITESNEDSSEPVQIPAKYKPSLAAIRSCLVYSVAELSVSLFTFALFVNSSILIVAGASLYNNAAAQTASLFGIHDLLSTNLAPVAGTIFALALLLSGTSAGIICTIAGQMVSEGQLNWSVKPWVRRLITRLITITPSIIIAGAVGQSGLSAALEASQVALSIILPITSAPLIYFTCRKKYMMVENGSTSEASVCMKNNWITATFAIVFWGLIVIMNVASWVLLGLQNG